MRRSPLFPPPYPLSEPNSRPKVVLVDDDRDSRELLATCLEKDGFSVTQAANGLRLLATLELHRPDVLLLDVNLTTGDGFELCRAVKRSAHFQNLPVVFVSARAAAEDVKRGIEVGAADYFIKPVELDTLRARVRDLLQPETGVTAP